VRNGIILGLLAPDAFASASGPLALMLAGAVVAALWDRRRHLTQSDDESGQPRVASAPPSVPVMTSPFSLSSALRFGLIFLALQIAATLAERYLGEAGLYALSIAGGVVSSASTVASAANLATAGSLTARIAGHSAIIASVASAMVNLPLVSRFGGNARLTRRTAVFIGTITALGALGVLAELLIP
jgi:uncharacterized membrane protein (DUF4010 family)